MSTDNNRQRTAELTLLNNHVGLSGNMNTTIKKAGSAAAALTYVEVRQSGNAQHINVIKRRATP